MTQERQDIAVYQTHDAQEVRLTVKDVRDFLCPEATEQEATMFMKVCQYQGLNPFLNEAYLVVYGHGDQRNVSIITGKDTFTKRAQRHPEFEGFQAGIVVETVNGGIEEREGTIKGSKEKLVGGWACVYRRDRRLPFRATADFANFNTGRKMWQSMPGVMIRKVALVNALREAFPEDLAGLYDGAERGYSLEDGKPPSRDEPTARQSQSRPEPVRNVDLDTGEIRQPEQGPLLDDIPVSRKLTQEEQGAFKNVCLERGIPGEEIRRIIVDNGDPIPVKLTDWTLSHRDWMMGQLDDLYPEASPEPEESPEMGENDPQEVLTLP